MCCNSKQLILGLIVLISTFTISILTVVNLSSSICEYKAVDSNQEVIGNATPLSFNLPSKRIYTCEEIKNYYSKKARDKRYVNGGVLNGKSCMIEPVYPKEAIENSVAGQVNVEVLVDGLGTVKSAKAVSGSPLLWKSSVDAAYKTKVHPTWLGGEPVNVKGILVYKFILPN